MTLSKEKDENFSEGWEITAVLHRLQMDIFSASFSHNASIREGCIYQQVKMKKFRVNFESHTADERWKFRAYSQSETPQGNFEPAL